MPPSSSRRSSKSGPSSSSGGGAAALVAAGGGESIQAASERREKAKSSQIYDERRRGSLRPESRRGSLKPEESGLRSVPERPALKGRNNSSSLIEVRTKAPSHSGQFAGESPVELRSGSEPFLPHANLVATGDNVQGQDEDEVAGVVGAVRQYQPFQNPEVEVTIPEINIAVIGAEGVGKSTFVQKAFDLSHQPASLAVEKRLPIDGNVYLVRLLELPIEEVDIDDDDNTISWPEVIDDKMMPKVDGALTLYDVKDKSTLESIPEMLTAMHRAALPSMLISCKCDAAPEERQVDPQIIETSAKRSVKNLTTLQTSASIPDTQKRGVSMLLRAIIACNLEPQIRSSSANRRRAQSSAVRPVSPRARSGLGHARASSEYTGSLHKEQRHARHDSSLAGNYGSSDRLTVPRQRSMEDAHGSFFFEESASEASHGSRRSSLSGTLVHSSSTPDLYTLAEKGGTLDELVDRLLTQPSSKADSKFAAIFLALYRKFAAPGMLLEAIVERFDSLDRSTIADSMRHVDQLRYLTVVEQWITAYPGDFAFPKTKRRMRTFLSKISRQKLFAATVETINAALDLVYEDDDTNWAYCDKDREVTDYLRVSISTTASTLIDDPSFLFQEFSFTSSDSRDDKSVATSQDTTLASSTLASSVASLQSKASVESARSQAQLLQPIPRQPLTKLQWRMLMDFPDELIAKELTKMDWIMFSSIRPRDLVRQVSLTSEQSAQYKNLVYVNRMIEHFNQLAFWVANYVLLRDKPKHRALMVEKMMRIARKLRELNNYNSLGAIIAGMKSSAVHRLAATRELIPPGVGKDWLKLEILMSPTRSHFSYRLAWENSSGERIPYLPLLRRDLVSAEQGNKTFVGDEKDGRINWRKFEIMGEVVVGMQKALVTPYEGLSSSSPHISQSIKDLILDVKLDRDEDDLFERSKQVEPSAQVSGVGATSTKIKEFFKRQP